MRNPFSYMKGSRRSPHAVDVPAVETPKARRSIREAVTDALGKDAFDNASSPSTQMTLALAHKNGPTYAGTVAQTTVARRRVANKRVRVARRVHRRAAH